MKHRLMVMVEGIAQKEMSPSVRNRVEMAVEDIAFVLETGLTSRTQQLINNATKVVPRLQKTELGAWPLDLTLKAIQLNHNVPELETSTNLLMEDIHQTLTEGVALGVVEESGTIVVQFFVPKRKLPMLIQKQWFKDREWQGFPVDIKFVGKPKPAKEDTDD